MGAYKGKYGNMLNDMFLDALEVEARAFIEKTLSHVVKGHASGYFEPETYNLYDSYGYGIYLDGKLQRSSATNELRPQRANEPRVFQDGTVLWGKDAMQELFDGTNRTTSKGYVIIIAASMPYAVNLELGLDIPRRYKVISFMESDAEQFGKSICGHSLVSKVNVRVWDEAGL